MLKDSEKKREVLAKKMSCLAVRQEKKKRNYKKSEYNHKLLKKLLYRQCVLMS